MQVRIEDPVGVNVASKTVTFVEDDGQETVYLMSPSLARVLKTRVETMETFKHGLHNNGKLTAMFRDPEDRDYCRDMLEDIWPGSEWEEVTC